MDVFMTLLIQLLSINQEREVIVRCEADDMNQCYVKAQKKCPSGYNIREFHARKGYLKVVCK
jgi:hypothetical protein